MKFSEKSEKTVFLHPARLLFISLLAMLAFVLATPQVYGQDASGAAQASNQVGGVAQWLALVLVFFGGAVGGVVFELLALQGRIELPHRPSPEEAKKDMTEEGNYAVASHMVDLGVIARVLIGGVAAIIALIVFTPTNLIQLLGVAAVAGSAGTSVFRTIQDRLLATLAQRDAALARAQTEKLAAKITETERIVGQLQTVLESDSNAPPKSAAILPEATPLVDATHVPESVHPPADALSMLDDVRRLLNEARGIGGAL